MKLLVLVAILAYATILILAFTVIIARQHTIDTLRHQIDDERGEEICRARLSADVASHEQRADTAEHELLVAVVEQLAIPIGERDFSGILELADTAERLNEETGAHITALQDYVEAGSPLPCPVR